jgi:prepilin-type N-terminal cleavage/methylation domain-containing protein
MKKLMSTRPFENARRAGFTLMELMVTLTLLGITTAAVTGLLAQQGASYQVVDQVSEVQQNMRAIADLMEREIRTAGFLVPQSVAVCGRDNDNASDVLFLSDADPLLVGAEMLGATITAGFSGTGTDGLSLDDLELDGAGFYDTDGDGIGDSDFRVGAGVIVADLLDSSRGASCGVITSLPGGTTINVNYANAGESIGAGGNLVAVPAHVYQVNAQNQLLRDGMVLADGVEDLQFAFFYDSDDDGVRDEPAEFPGSNNTYASNAWNNEILREIRFNVVVRTAADPSWSQGQFQAKENRIAPAGGPDGFRRRVFTASVRPRNVGRRGGL